MSKNINSSEGEWERRKREAGERIKRLRNELGTNTEVLANKALELEKEQNRLLEIIRPYQERLEKIYRDKDAVEELIQEIKVEAMKSGEPDWATLLAYGDSQAMYNQFDREIRRLGLIKDGGYWADTEQRVIKLSLIRNDPESLSAHLNAVKTLLPYLLTDSDGYARFSIFEHNLSAHGVWRLKIDPQTEQSSITLSRGMRDSEKCKFSTLREALEYIQENLYYSDSHENTEEEGYVP